MRFKSMNIQILIMKQYYLIYTIADVDTDLNDIN